MGKQRNQTNKIILFLSYLLLFSMILISGCTKKTLEKNNQMILDNWVKKEYSKEGILTYGVAAKIVISAPLTISFPDIEAYRGTITSKEKQWDGIFFINKKDQSVEFMDVGNQKMEGK
jgi:hypothetical protein